MKERLIEAEFAINLDVSSQIDGGWVKKGKGKGRKALVDYDRLLSKIERDSVTMSKKFLKGKQSGGDNAVLNDGEIEEIMDKIGRVQESLRGMISKREQGDLEGDKNDTVSSIDEQEMSSVGVNV